MPPDGQFHSLHMHMHTSEHSHIRAYICMHSHVCRHTPTRVHQCVHLHMYRDTRVCTHMCAHVHTSGCLGPWAPDPGSEAAPVPSWRISGKFPQVPVLLYPVCKVMSILVQTSQDGRAPQDTLTNAGRLAGTPEMLEPSVPPPEGAGVSVVGLCPPHSPTCEAALDRPTFTRPLAASARSLPPASGTEPSVPSGGRCAFERLGTAAEPRKMPSRTRLRKLANGKNYSITD